MIEEALFDAEEKMEKAVAVARDDLSSIRTGRANPGMFARVVVDYYGSPTPITQLSSVNVPEARMVVIKPYEASPAAARSRTRSATPTSGVNPTNDGNIIRVSIPQLTEERRRDLVKQAKSKGEDAKVSVRNIRRRRWRNCTASARTARPARTRSAARRRTWTRPPHTYVGQIDELVKHKEGELLEV